MSDAERFDRLERRVEVLSSVLSRIIRWDTLKGLDVVDKEILLDELKRAAEVSR